MHKIIHKASIFIPSLPRWNPGSNQIRHSLLATMYSTPERRVNSCARRIKYTSRPWDGTHISAPWMSRFYPIKDNLHQLLMSRCVRTTDWPFVAWCKAIFSFPIHYRYYIPLFPYGNIDFRLSHYHLFNYIQDLLQWKRKLFLVMDIAAEILLNWR